MTGFIKCIGNISLTALLFLSVQGIGFAQTYIDVAPGPATLTDAIAGNTIPNAIFRLQRGVNAVYTLNGSITTSIPISIVAVDGTGARPQLLPQVATGGTTAIPFSVSASLTLKGLYVTAQDELGGYQNAQVIRLKADNIRLIIDDCFLENSTQSCIRTDNKNAKIYITNTTIRNMVSDFANGRGIDDRGVDMDTLFVQNSTIYSLGSRFLRDGGGVLNYAFFNHNTIVNTGLQVAQFGECPQLIFKNNMLVNCGFIGTGQTDYASGSSGLLQLKPLTSTVYQGRTQSVAVSNNNFYLNPAFSSLYSDTVKAVPRFDNLTNSYVTASGLDNTNLSEAISFTTAPPSLAGSVTDYWTDPLLSSSPTAIKMRANGTYNFAYPTTAACYTKGTGNQPIGALTWFNMPLGVNDIYNSQPTDFSLSQNYPNPFNPSTLINYTIASESAVNLTVYNSVGQLIKTLVNKVQASGNYTVNWDGTNQSAQKLVSGIYFYQLKAGNSVITKKMMLVK